MIWMANNFIYFFELSTCHRSPRYMTNGVIVALGDVGRNVAAGMSGGILYLYEAGHPGEPSNFLTESKGFRVPQQWKCDSKHTCLVVRSVNIIIICIHIYILYCVSLLDFIR